MNTIENEMIELIDLIENGKGLEYGNNYIRWKFEKEVKEVIILHSNSLFSEDTRDKMKDFLYIVCAYYKNNSVDKLFKTLKKGTTTDTRNNTKEKKALAGAKNIIDLLGGVATYNEDSKNLKALLYDFINDIEKYKVENIKFIKLVELRKSLRHLLKDKSFEIENFTKDLPNF